MDSLVTKLREAGVPSAKAVKSWHRAVRDGRSGFSAQCDSIAADRAAILRVLLAERLAEMTDDEYERFQDAVLTDDSAILAVLCPEVSDD